MTEQTPSLLPGYSRSEIVVGDLDSLSIAEVYETTTGLDAQTHKFISGLLVRCPSANHEDVHPSCVLRTDKGTWGCKSCDAGGGKLDMVIAAGKAHSRAEARVWLAHNTGRPAILHPQPPPRSRPDRHRVGRRTLRAIYSYLEANGTLTEQCVRYAVTDVSNDRPKDFDIRRPDGAGRWIYHHRSRCDRSECACHGNGPLATITPPLVPYNLPAILRAGREGRMGILVEGEADAEALIALGFAATTNAWGTDFQYPQSWKHYFDSVRRWIVLTDSDLPGRKAAAQRAAFIGPRAKVVDLFPEAQTHKNGPDVSDWLAQHPGTLAEQRQLLEETLRAALLQQEHHPASAE